MAAGAAAALATHAVPLVTTRASLRRRYLPRLAGLGRADHVALTFDDGPDPASTPLFLEELDRLGMHATFFMLGVNADVHRSVAAPGGPRGPQAPAE
jgi:peptidoglycan/xylan/chitin deacetylase (PgdA/CDA1 family)